MSENEGTELLTFTYREMETHVDKVVGHYQPLSGVSNFRISGNGKSLTKTSEAIVAMLE